MTYYTDKELYKFGITDYYDILRMKDKIENKHEALKNVLEAEISSRKLDFLYSTDYIVSEIEGVILRDISYTGRIKQINDILKVHKPQKSKFKHKIELKDSSWDDYCGYGENRDKFIYLLSYIKDVNCIYEESPVKQNYTKIESELLYSNEPKVYNSFKESGLIVNREGSNYTVEKTNDDLLFILTVQHNLEHNDHKLINHGSEFTLYIVSDWFI